jgi:S-adenosylmethionine:tRNA ribosyltransferase-isomerase
MLKFYDTIQPMYTADFDYKLPKELIAQTPVDPRDHSRLLTLDRHTGTITHVKKFFRITDYIHPGDVLVFNNTKVLPSRLLGKTIPDAKPIELLLLRRLSPGIWHCIGKPGKRLISGSVLQFGRGDSVMQATVIKEHKEGFRTIRLEGEEELARVGNIPVPPYIRDPLKDPTRYQTVFARIPGSAAAPTAGLHFTKQLIQKLCENSIELAFVTLHIGPGTFRPVSTEDPRNHFLDPEAFHVTNKAAATINRAKLEGRKVICVGTTTMRVVETIAAKQNSSPPLKAGDGWADLLILPGHEFKVADGLITNFHLPRSSLLMLVSAFAGTQAVLGAYRTAIAEQYRFASLGDGMLIK